MLTNPYHLLAVSPDSTPDDWKRAFRRLAMRWHPDRSNDPLATERFKEINAAYELLLNPQAEDEAVEEEAAQADEGEVMPRAADIRLNVEISLAEGATGCRKTIHYTRG